MRATRAAGALSPSKKHIASDWEEEFSSTTDTCPTTGLPKEGAVSASDQIYAISHFLLSTQGDDRLVTTVQRMRNRCVTDM